MPRVRPFPFPYPVPLLSRLAGLLMVSMLMAPTSTWASHPAMPPTAARASALGELDAVAATSYGVLAVGSKSLYVTRPPCGQVFHEITTSTGWKASYAVNRGSRACAWRTGIAADPRGGAWAVGYYVGSDGNPRTLTEHFNGKGWSVVASPAPGAQSILNAVVAGPNHQVWAVGQYQTRGSGLEIGTMKTLTMVNNGSGWKVVSSPNPSSVDNGLNGVAASSGGQIWAVGFDVDTNEFANHTLTMVNSGSGWQIVSSPSPGNTTVASGNSLNAVAPGGSGVLWAVGFYTDSGDRTRPLTMSYRAGAWTVVPSPSPGSGASELRAVVAAPGGRVWAAGYLTRKTCSRTLTEVYGGSAWQVVHSPNPNCTASRGNALNGLAVDRHGTLYAVGDTNITALILTNTGSGWRVAAH